MLAQQIAFFVVICVSWQVSGLPFVSHPTEIGSENKDSKFSENLKSFHIFPHWVTEIGEIFLFAIHYAWHHELTEHIQEVGNEVSEINSKLDAILATSPAASRIFSQLSKSSHHSSHQRNQYLIWDYTSSTLPAIQQPPIVRRKKTIADDNRKRSNNY